MKRNLTRLLALTLVLIFAVGLLPTVHADEDVRIRDTAYSETLGLRAAMTGKISDPAVFSVSGPEGPLTITEVIEGEKNIYTLVTAEGTVEVAPISAMVLVQPAAEPAPTEPVEAEPVPKGNENFSLIVAAFGMMLGIGCGYLWMKKR